MHRHHGLLAGPRRLHVQLQRIPSALRRVHTPQEVVEVQCVLLFADCLHRSLVGVLEHLHWSRLLGKVGPSRSHGGLQSCAWDEPNTHTLCDHWKMRHLPLHEGTLDDRYWGLTREQHLGWQRLAEVGGYNAVTVHVPRQLGLEEGHAFAQDQRLVVAQPVHALGHNVRDENTQHQWRDKGKVMCCLHKDDHNSYRHVRKAAEHGGAAHHGIHTGIRKGHVQALAEALRANGFAHESATKRTDEHRGQEVAHGHRQAGHSRSKRRVDPKSQRQGSRVRRPHIPRKQVLHGALSTLEEDGGHSVVGPLRAGVPDKPREVLLLLLEQAPPRFLDAQGVAWTRHFDAAHKQGDKGKGQRTEEGVQHALSNACLWLPALHGARQALAEAPDTHDDPREESTEEAKASGQQSKEGHVYPVPAAPFLVLLHVDQESVNVLARKVEQGFGDQCPANAADEDSEGEFGGPGCHGRLLKHVEDATDGRIESGGYARRTTKYEPNPLHLRKAFLVNNQCRRAVVLLVGAHLHPMAGPRKRHEVGDAISQRATNGYHRPFTANGESSSQGQDDAHHAHRQNTDFEDTSDAIAIQETLGLRQARASTHGRHHGYKPCSDGTEAHTDRRKCRRSRANADIRGQCLHCTELPAQKQAVRPNHQVVGDRHLYGDQQGDGPDDVSGEPVGKEGLTGEPFCSICADLLRPGAWPCRSVRGCLSSLIIRSR
mmetsp:Transcript_5908/g.14016  ORF Transcript_5908/g.14016 Transcript_5908/m.14016 type:complete len:713 (-) Transcript_5908:53-2191(-)